MASTFSNRMEDLSDGQLTELGVHRDDIPVVAAAAAGLFRVANNATNAKK